MALACKATVHCGTVSMDWDVLYHAVMALSRLRGDGSHFWNKETGKPRRIGASNMRNIGKLNEIRNDIWASGEEKSRQIFDCMNNARAFECRDDEDQVFAMLGILTVVEKIPLKESMGRLWRRSMKNSRSTASDTAILWIFYRGRAKSTYRQWKTAWKSHHGFQIGDFHTVLQLIRSLVSALATNSRL